MKPCSEMLLEVTVYCSKVRDQRGLCNRDYKTVACNPPRLAWGIIVRKTVARTECQSTSDTSYTVVTYGIDASTAIPCHPPWVGRASTAAAGGRIGLPHGLPAALWRVRRRQAVERANRYALEKLPHGGLELA